MQTTIHRYKQIQLLFLLTSLTLSNIIEEYELCICTHIHKSDEKLDVRRNMSR